MNSGYESYMRSSEWRRKRLLALERDGWECRCCDAVAEGWHTKEELQVHHRHYRNFGNELLEDLETLCPTCHDAITAVHRRRRYSVKDLPGAGFTLVNSTPLEVKRGVSIAKLQANGSGADHSAQWQERKPARSVVKSPESHFQQALQNGRRS